MKKATCRDLRGACDELITGKTADEMGARRYKPEQHEIAELESEG